MAYVKNENICEQKKKKVKTTVVCDGIDALKKEMNPNTNYSC